MAYMETYQKWLASPALSEAEKAELRSIANDPKEIESRFFGPLEFGTAGLRGTMAVGLNRMNIHVIRHATQAFAEVIKAEGQEAVDRGVVVCFDCRNHSQEFAQETACVMAGQRHQGAAFRRLAPHSRAVLCRAGVSLPSPASMSPPATTPRSTTAIRSIGRTAHSCRPTTPAAIAAKMDELDIFDSIHLADYDEAVRNGMITLIGDETDEKFLANVMAQVNDPEQRQKGGRQFLDHLHPLPRHRLQADP